MEDQGQLTADPEKVDLSNLLLTGKEFKFNPDFSHTAPKLQVSVTFAPVAQVRGENGYTTNTRGIFQAARCPVCGSLVAVGPSFADHVYFCRRSRP